MLILGFLNLSVGTINSSADIRIESDTFSVDIDDRLLESRLEQNGSLLVAVEKLQRIDGVTKVRLGVTNPTNAIVPLIPIRIMIGAGLSAEQDVGGGFGSSFYRYLDPFISSESGIVMKILGRSDVTLDSAPPTPASVPGSPSSSPAYKRANSS